MRHASAWPAALGLLLVAAPAAFGRWGGGGCAPAGPVGPPAYFAPQFQPAPQFEPAPASYQAPAEEYSWGDHPGDPGGEMILYRGRVGIGTFFRRTGEYCPYDHDARRWLPACEPPHPLPHAIYGGAPDKGEKVKNFGLDSEKLNQGGKRYWVNGAEVSRDRAFQALRDRGELKDDSKAPWLVCIGPDAATARVKKDWESHPALAPFREKFRTHFCDPAKYFAVAQQYGYKDGSPAIYLQAASGKVLHRQDDYRGPEKLAEAVRKADPSYDPAKDPDLNKKNGLPAVDLKQLAAQVPPWAWGALGIGALWLLSVYRGKQR